MTATDRDPMTVERIEQLVRENDGLIWQITHRWARRNPSVDLEDLYAEVRLGFVIAAWKYDPSAGAKFVTYAGWWGENRARQLAHQEAARGQHVPQHAGIVKVCVGSIDIPDDGGGGEMRGVDAVTPAPDVPAEFPGDLWERIRAVVRPYEYDALVGWFRDGRHMADIGRDSGVCRERVRRRIASAIETVRRELPHLREYLEEK